MENIAEAVGLDPVQVRIANMAEVGSNPVPAMAQYWRQYTDYEERLAEIKQYNKVGVRHLIPPVCSVMLSKTEVCS